MVKKLVSIFCALAGLALATIMALYFWFVVFSPGEAIQQQNIEKILGMESPVYYADGRSKIGVFFRDNHRQYVSYHRLPGTFVKGLVAAEDNDFFNHFGVDPAGFARAVLANIRAGRIVQGGSTISQQTAKNLFHRQGRSLKAKLHELLYALRLEYHYPKEKILEFYANQFYVSGNGRGLGVAARYYFDKEPEDLDLLESAFIVGSVKRPNYYNPFIQQDGEAVARARTRSRQRASYVLGRMYNLGMIDTFSYQDALAREIPFKRGRMRFELSSIMDMVRDGLESDEVRHALLAHGIENVATSGIRITTTINRDFQEKTLTSLQTELSRLDTRLNGYNGENLQETYRLLQERQGSATPVAGRFLVARVAEVDREKHRLHLDLGFGGKLLTRFGVIDEQGLRPLLSSLVRYKGHRWSEIEQDSWDWFMEMIQPGDLVHVSIIGEVEPAGKWQCRLEKYPEIQGAVIGMQKGMITSLAGGRDNFYFNRAVAARRPMGSVVKPLLFAAAIQLGWNNLDLLDNRRNVFVFQNTPYIPRPDHDSPHDYVSMSWAGVHSENVASVWLLYHLCDRLSPAQFKELTGELGLRRQPGESYRSYIVRIRDEMGIVVNDKALRQASLEKAVAAVEADLVFAGRQRELGALQQLRYAADHQDLVAEEDKGREAVVKRRVLTYSFQRLQGLEQDLRAMATGLAAEPGPAGLMDGLFYQPLADKSPLHRHQLDLIGQQFMFTDRPIGSGWLPVRRDKLVDAINDLPADGEEKFWNRVRLDNMVSAGTISMVAEYLEQEYDLLRQLPPYGDDVLYHIRDYRVLAALKYVIGLCRAAGVESRLDPVLSFPLGSNVISLLEAARLYETITGGKSYQMSDNAGLRVISRIENSEGEILYEAARQEKQVVDEQTALQVADILRNVVRFGTGRFASRNIRLTVGGKEQKKVKLGAPVLGKTGTANQFKNASFVGVVPGLAPDSKVLSLAEGHVLATYTGFDDNRPMVRTSTHFTGASGALPLWSRVAEAMLNHQLIGSGIDFADLAFAGHKVVPLTYPDLGQVVVPVDRQKGGRAGDGGDGSGPAVVTFGHRGEDGSLEFNRYFRPYWHGSLGQVAE